MFAIDNYDFKGKRAIIRVDFNVPLDGEGHVTDDTRIRAAIPTIKKVLEKGGAVILMSHLGRPKKNPDPKFSLEQIVPAIEARLGQKILFAGDCMGEKAAEMAKNLKPGEVMLLENLRFYAEEEGKPRGLAEDATDEEKKAEEKGIKIVTSPDALIADAFSADANTAEAPADNIPDNWEGVDIGEQGKKLFREEILGCKTILWNGPVGVFEIDKFATGSRAVAEAIAEATANGAFSLIGGGDSVACINKFGLADKVSYVSTGGGALLEYMEGKELPGVAAIRK